MSGENRVLYCGVPMIEGWPQQIEEALRIVSYDIDGHPYPRIRYGDEPDDWGANEMPCHDCRVFKGELHVVGCDVERCPRCGHQVISCDCVKSTQK